MKKRTEKRGAKDELRREYDFSKLKGGVRWHKSTLPAIIVHPFDGCQRDKKKVQRVQRPYVRVMPAAEAMGGLPGPRYFEAVR